MWSAAQWVCCRWFSRRAVHRTCTDVGSRTTIGEPVADGEPHQAADERVAHVLEEYVRHAVPAAQHTTAS